MCKKSITSLLLVAITFFSLALASPAKARNEATVDTDGTIWARGVDDTGTGLACSGGTDVWICRRLEEAIKISLLEANLLARRNDEAAKIPLINDTVEGESPIRAREVEISPLLATLQKRHEKCSTPAFDLTPESDLYFCGSKTVDEKKDADADADAELAERQFAGFEGTQLSETFGNGATAKHAQSWLVLGVFGGVLIL